MFFFFIFVLSTFFVLNLNFLSKKIKIFDKPDNNRKIHKTPVPLLGGIFLFIIIILTIFFDTFLNDKKVLENREISAFLIGVLFFFLIGLYDDIFKLSPTKKLVLTLGCILFVIHIDDKLIINSLIFSFLEKEINLSNFSTIFTILCFLIFVNALNMFDGMNGQCSLYSIVLCLIFTLYSSYQLYLVSLIIGLCFFILVNLRSKSFLGDSGSYLLGFVISFFIIKTYNSEASLNSDLIFILMYFPGFDLIRLFVIRLVNNKNPFSADKNHIHHIYLKKFNNKLSLLMIQLLCFAPFALSFYIKDFMLILIFAILLYSLPIYYINKR